MTSDPYLIPGTDVLRNKLRVTSQTELHIKEAEFVGIRMLELAAHPPHVHGTVSDLQRIHRHLFQDIYDWAGQIRVIDMGKGTGDPFQPLSRFGIGAAYAERVLHDAHMLRGLSKESFVAALSRNYDNFNILHPFREGNGRTQRIFWSIIAFDAGWELDWSKTNSTENDRASHVARNTMDYSLLERMFDVVVRPRTPEDTPLGSLGNMHDSLSDGPMTYYEDIGDYEGIPSAGKCQADSGSSYETCVMPPHRSTRLTCRRPS